MKEISRRMQLRKSRGWQREIQYDYQQNGEKAKFNQRLQDMSNKANQQIPHLYSIIKSESDVLNCLATNLGKDEN